MTRRREELLNEPVTHLVLKKTAAQGEKDTEELSREIGVKHYRVKKRSRELEGHGFVELHQGRKIIIEQDHRENLEAFRDSILDFARNHHERLLQNFEDVSQKLSKEVEALKMEKKETDSVKKEKKLDRKIESVEEALDQDVNSPRTSLEAFSRVHRARKFVGIDAQFHGFNPMRKSRTIVKLEQILSEKPDEDKVRTFFGNRWVVRDSE